MSMQENTSQPKTPKPLCFFVTTRASDSIHGDTPCDGCGEPFHKHYQPDPEPPAQKYWFCLVNIYDRHDQLVSTSNWRLSMHPMLACLEWRKNNPGYKLVILWWDEISKELWDLPNDPVVDFDEKSTMTTGEEEPL